MAEEVSVSTKLDYAQLVFRQIDRINSRISSEGMDMKTEQSLFAQWAEIPMEWKLKRYKFADVFIETLRKSLEDLDGITLPEPDDTTYYNLWEILGEIAIPPTAPSTLREKVGQIRVTARLQLITDLQTHMGVILRRFFNEKFSASDIDWIKEEERLEKEREKYAGFGVQSEIEDDEGLGEGDTLEGEEE